MCSSLAAVRVWVLTILVAFVITSGRVAHATDHPYVIECAGSDIADTLQELIYDGVHPYILINSNPAQIGNERDCVISKTIKILNRTGLRIEGEGRDKTVLRWSGPVDQPMFSLKNSSGISFAHFSIMAGVLVDDPEIAGTMLISAFDMYNACFDEKIENPHGDVDLCSPYSPGYPPGSHGNSFEDILIQQGHGTNKLLNGIRVLLHPEYLPVYSDLCGTDIRADCDNGGHVFDHVHIITFRESAFVLEGQKSVGNVFRDTHCRGTFLGSSLNDPDIHNVQTINPACCGDSCVRSGREGYPKTAGSFSWYGGLANGVADSAFVIGENADKVHISGLYSERCHRLLRTFSDSGTEDDSDLAVYEHGPDISIDDASPGPSGESSHLSPTSGGITIESMFFDTQWMNQWEGADADYGVMVDARHSSSLAMRGNLIGYRGDRSEGANPNDSDWVAICWSPGEETSEGSFIFEGNAIGTKTQNPFHPWSGSNHLDDCIYPTIQRANLWAPKSTWSQDDPETIPGVHDSWIPMPQQFTAVDTLAASTFSVFDSEGSHGQFFVEGSSSIECIEDGFEGQRIVLLNDPDASATDSTTIEQATNPGLWTISGCRNISLRNGLAMKMYPGDTLTLIKGADYLWYELGRSEN